MARKNKDNPNKWIDKLLLSMKGVEKDFKAEWHWTRYMISGKMFAAILKNDQGVDDRLSLKLLPEEGSFLREQHTAINAGYYMNKVHWNTIDLDNTVPNELIEEMLKKSYDLILSGFSKKKQKELLGE